MYMKARFGEFLIEKGVIDPFALVQALNIQRRRGLIPLCEIALHDKLLSADKLLSVLDVQENTGRRFGDIALEFGYLSPSQIEILCKKQHQLHSHIGEILVEMNKLNINELNVLLSEFRSFEIAKTNPHSSDVIIEDASDIDLFLSFEVTCPICSQVSSQQLVKNSLYEVEKRDIDFKPAVYKWPGSAKVNCSPQLLNIWQCPACHFSLGHDEFEDPTRDIPPSLNNFRKKVIDLRTNDSQVNNVVHALSADDNFDDCNGFITTIRRYLLAIHLHSKIPLIAEQEGVPIAQLCHHLAWVYRELHHAVKDDSYIMELKKIKLTIGQLWPDVPLTETAALEMALFYYDVAVYQSITLVERSIVHKVLQLMGRIYIRLKRIRDARRLLLDTIMNGNKQIASFKAQLKPDTGEFNRQHNKGVMQELCRINAFVKETKSLLEFCGTLK